MPKNASETRNLVLTYRYWVTRRLLHM